jgi:hypothetical protein
MKTRYELSRAILMYNRFTNPSVMRSDDEHAINRRAARKVRTYLRRHFGRAYAECNSGRLYEI